MSEDNWQHRAENMRCNTCMHYVAKNPGVGRCRRRAPTMNGFPVVFRTDWCGDHKLSDEACMPTFTVEDDGMGTIRDRI
jgi:hypothetical protein